jgi:Family of unknown function (DUF6134)
MTTLRPAGVLGFYILCAAGTAAASAPEPGGNWHFTVLLNGKRIGMHDFMVTQRADETDVVTEAHFKVKAAFLSLYQYDHQDHEVWHGSCLAQITSQTRDNGKSFAVQGELRGDTFQVQDSRGAATLPVCVQTFAYWDQHFLTEPRLLNSQTGEFQAVTLTREGPESLKVHGRMIPALRYSLRGPKLDIELWYAASGDWVALESKLESGRTLRYEIE